MVEGGGVTKLWEVDRISVVQHHESVPKHWRFRNHFTGFTFALELVEKYDEYVVLKELMGKRRLRLDKELLLLSDQPDEEWVMNRSSIHVRYSGRLWEGKFNDDKTAWTTHYQLFQLQDETSLTWLETAHSSPLRHQNFVELSRSSQHVTMFDSTRQLCIRLGPTCLEFLPAFSRDKEKWYFMKSGRWSEDETSYRFNTSFQSFPMTSWSVEQVCDFLLSLGMTKYISSFQTNEIDGATLVMLEEGDFLDCLKMVNVIERKKLLGHIKVFRERLTPSRKKKIKSKQEKEEKQKRGEEREERRGGGKETEEREEREEREGRKEREKRVFLSYCWENQKEVLKMRDLFLSFGISVWMDVDCLKTGDNVLLEIDSGIRGADLFVSCLSKGYVTSTNCRKEALLADLLKKTMVCVLLEPPPSIPWPPPGPIGPVFAGTLYLDGSKCVSSDLVENIVDTLGRVLPKKKEEEDS